MTLKLAKFLDKAILWLFGVVAALFIITIFLLISLGIIHLIQ